mmetsp:Transcript_98453/g.301166  ORF Transcript_98453/g.301166 Transcript_98453/m.301166 type:complete len:244 (+) Transcript_98453:144-875(+)
MHVHLAVAAQSHETAGNGIANEVQPLHQEGFVLHASPGGGVVQLGTRVQNFTGLGEAHEHDDALPEARHDLGDLQELRVRARRGEAVLRQAAGRDHARVVVAVVQQSELLHDAHLVVLDDQVLVLRFELQLAARRGGADEGVLWKVGQADECVAWFQDKRFPHVAPGQDSGDGHGGRQAFEVFETASHQVDFTAAQRDRCRVLDQEFLAHLDVRSDAIVAGLDVLARDAKDPRLLCPEPHPPH